MGNYNSILDEVDNDIRIMKSRLKNSRYECETSECQTMNKYFNTVQCTRINGTHDEWSLPKFGDYITGFTANPINSCTIEIRCRNIQRSSKKELPYDGLISSYKLNPGMNNVLFEFTDHVLRSSMPYADMYIKITGGTTFGIKLVMKIRFIDVDKYKYLIFHGAPVPNFAAYAEVKYLDSCKGYVYDRTFMTPTPTPLPWLCREDC